MSGSTTINNSTPAIGAVNIQQSSYGLTVTLLWGRTRISGNLIWYGDFKAIPHTEVTQQGGKGGGGVKTASTTYTYQAAVAMALCRGPISSVRTVWRGKSMYAGGPLGNYQARVTDTLTLDANKRASVANPLGWVDVSVELLVPNTVAYDNNYQAPARRKPLVKGVDYTASNGVYTVSSASPGDKVAITYTYASGYAGSSALAQIGLDLMKGDLGQAPWSYLQSRHPSQAVGYSTIAYVYGQTYALTGNAEVDNHSFEIDGPLQFSQAIPDANPAAIVPDALNNPIYGAQFGAERLGSMTDYANACAAQGIFLSPALTEQTQAADFLQTMAQLTNVGLVWSNGVLKFVPYADTTISGNGVTYTPDTTPVYDLTDDDFLPYDDGDPVKVTRGSKNDSFNSVKVEFRDRANGYNLAIMPAADDTDIADSGLRQMPTITAHWITEANVAKIVATLILQRAMFVRNTYSFKLNWTKIALEPMNLVTLTDVPLGLNKYAVRIVDMEESEEGEIEFKAEDFPQGSASATLYPTTTGAGFAHNYNVAPGSALAPVIFEAPVSLTSSSSGLEIWLATGGTDPNYGGCEVWVSLDGTNYGRAYVLKGSSRYGVTTTAMQADSSAGVYAESVNLTLSAGGQLLSGSAADRDRLTTLCYVDGEFLAYDAATLTGDSAYRLGPSLNRGAYGSGQAAHAAGVPFVRCDDGIARMSLTADYIGQTLHVKLLAFNNYQGGIQSLSDVPEYTYVVTGRQANLAPLAPKGLALEGPFTINTAKFRWNAVDRAASYNVQVWAGAPLAKVREVNVGDALRFDYSAGDARADGGPWRALQLRVQGINENGAQGAFATLSVSNPQVGSLTGVSVTPGANSIGFACAAPADPDFMGVQLWLGTTQNFTPATGNLVYDGPNTQVIVGRDGAGAQLVAGTTYYLKWAGYDSFDKAGLSVGASDAIQLLQLRQVAIVQLFQWAVAKPAAPGGTSVFDWSTGANGSYNGTDGWSSLQPNNPGGNAQLWSATVTLSVAAGTASSSVGYSSAGIASVSQNGASGFQVATAIVYRWDVSAPAGPTGNGSFKWSDGTFGAAPAGWSLTGGTAPAQGMTLYAARVLISDSAVAATTPFNWASAAVGIIATAPYNGASYVTAYCASSYTGALVAPAATTGIGSVPAVNGGNVVGTWGKATPALSAGQYQYQSDGIYDPATDKVTWSIPYWSSLKVATLSAITANLGAINAGSINLGNGVFTVDNAGNLVCSSITIKRASDGVVLLSSGGAGVIPDGIANAKTMTYQSYQDWNFDATVEGWYMTGGSITAGAGYITLNSAGGDPILESPATNFPGALYDKVRVRIRRTAGSGWDGGLYSNNEGVDGYVFLANPNLPIGGDWQILEYDLSGSATWKAQTINHIRLDFGTTPADKFDVDFISIGRYAPAPSVSTVAAAAKTADWASVTGTNKPQDLANFVPPGRGSAINNDPCFENIGNDWVVGNGLSLGSGTAAAYAAASNYLTNNQNMSATNLFATSKARYAIDPSKVYSLTANLYAAPGNNRNMYVFVQMYDGNGNYIDGSTTGWGAAMSGYVYGGQPPQGQFSRQGGQFGPGTGRTIPGNARYVEIGVWFQYAGTGSSSVEQAAQDIRLETVISQALIDPNFANTLSDKISKAAGGILQGAITLQTTGGIGIGSLTWNSAGNRNGGYGVGITSYGIAAYNSSGVATFSLDASTGNAMFAGTLSAASGTLGSVHLPAGGSIHSGAYSAWAWPASGQRGFYLGPEGLLLGNANDNRFFQVDANSGSIFAPGFSLVNAQLTLTAPVIVNPNISGATLDSFTATLSGSAGGSYANGSAGYGTLTANPSGGKAPYSYRWTLTLVLKSGSAGNMVINSTTSQSASFSGSGTNATLDYNVTCIVTDANGRTVTLGQEIVSNHGTPP